MAEPDTCCTLVPYFKIHEGQIESFKQGCNAFVEKTRSEPGCLSYAFSFDGNEAYCREGYADAAALLSHLKSVGGLLAEALTKSDITRLEVHGPASELDKLRQPLGEMNPQFYTLEMGFRR
jgi:quinol monooxygenase YgiN